MLVGYKKKTNIGIGLAFVTFFAAILINSLSESQIVSTIAFLVGSITMPLWIFGVWCYAKGKGYHGAWGLLGVFTLIGFIILACFPDRHKSISESQKIKGRF